MVLGDAYEAILARKAAETAPKPDWRSYAKPVGIAMLIYALWMARKGKR